jgi:hypothetical protein
MRPDDGKFAQVFGFFRKKHFFSGNVPDADIKFYAVPYLDRFLVYFRSDLDGFIPGLPGRR